MIVHNYIVETNSKMVNGWLLDFIFDQMTYMYIFHYHLCQIIVKLLINISV